MTEPTRCWWPKADDPQMVAYHDDEWGVPVHDDRKLFEFLVLDAFQAGLSWAVVLHKREAFRRAFADFEAERVARFTARRIERLTGDASIIRNRQKIAATVTNARAFLAIQEAHGSFDRFIWDFVDGMPKQNRWRSLKQVPAKTKVSDAMSAALKKEGFSFVGSTICYAFMQAAGLVNDHLVRCFRHAEVRALAR
ncbi:MAG TPA: DNA-3-methyladenine glycosylase I [Gemmatimonadales bacterium]|nr:DNA-3-methyladenine glycosylase I [Gemmatimonadales bacterium]